VTKFATTSATVCTREEELSFCEQEGEPVLHADSCETGLAAHCKQDVGEGDQCKACVDQLDASLKRGCSRRQTATFCAKPASPPPGDAACFTFTDYSQQLDGAHAACCDGFGQEQNCQDGTPQICDESCAPVFTAFWGSCASFVERSVAETGVRLLFETVNARCMQTIVNGGQVHPSNRIGISLGCDEDGNCMGIGEGGNEGRGGGVDPTDNGLGAIGGGGRGGPLHGSR
jgi:hypothetical protein